MVMMMNSNEETLNQIEEYVKQNSRFEKVSDLREKLTTFYGSEFKEYINRCIYKQRGVKRKKKTAVPL